MFIKNLEMVFWKSSTKMRFVLNLTVGAIFAKEKSFIRFIIKKFYCFIAFMLIL